MYCKDSKLISKVVRIVIKSMSAESFYQVPLEFPFFEYVFKNHDLIKYAILHPSLSQRRKTHKKKDVDFDRMEFVGDRILGLVIASTLYARYPQADEGELSLRSANLVCMDTLYKICIKCGLDKYIQYDTSGYDPRMIKNLFADAMEAFLAALFLDGGLDVVKKFIHQYWGDLIDNESKPLKRPKTALQEYLHLKKMPAPVYVLMEKDGPPHAPEFTMQVQIPQTNFSATAVASSVKEAENMAALTLLNILKGLKK